MIAHLSHPSITIADIAAELDREASYRARTYPPLVERMKMTAEEADYQRTIFAALQEDVGRMRACWEQRKIPAPAPAHAFTWAERRQALRRELELRARHFPRWISEGKLDRAGASQRCACLTALLRIFEDGWDWTPPNAAPCNWASIDPTRGEQQTRDAWRTWQHQIAQAHDDGAQQELSL